MTSCCGFSVYLSRQVDLECSVNRDKAAEIPEHQRIVSVRSGAETDRGVAIGEAIEPARAHQHRRDGDPRIEFLALVIDNAGLHQIGNSVADRAGMDAKAPFAAERMRHRLRDGAEAQLYRCLVGDQPGDALGNGALNRPRRPGRQLEGRFGGRHQDIEDSWLDNRVAVGPRQFGVDLRDNQARPIERRVQVLDAKPAIVASGIVRSAHLQQYDVDRQAPAGNEARNIGNIGRHYVVGALSKKSPSSAGAAQGCDGDVRMTGGKAVAEGQRKEHAERWATFSLSIEQPREKQGLGGGLGPADCLTGAN
jgi:hypothetical protein